MANLTEFLAFHARRTPGRTALAYNGAEISYAEMMARAHSGARWLAERGIGKGDVVALLMKNSAAFFDLVFAVSHQGAVLLPINYRLAANEIEYILSNASATLLIADQEFEGVTSQLPEGSVDSIFLLDSSAQADIRSVVVTSGSFPPAHCSNIDLMRLDRKSTRLNSSHSQQSRMPSSA